MRGGGRWVLVVGRAVMISCPPLSAGGDDYIVLDTAATLNAIRVQYQWLGSEKQLLMLMMM